MVLVTLTLLMAQAGPLPPPRRANPDVVVVGRAAAALDACLARQCPPDEEAAAALAAADGAYLAGDYRRARRVIGASLDRLRGRARQFPGPVADLLGAAARLDAHEGYFADHDVEYRRAYLVMRDAYGTADARVVERRLGLADALLDSGEQAQALHEFAGAVADAEAVGDAGLRARARLRYAAAILREPDRGGEQQRVQRLLAPVLAGTDPGLERHRAVARLILARLAARHGNAGALAATTATVAASAAQPLLMAAEQPHLKAYEQDSEACQPTLATSTGPGARAFSGAFTMLGCDGVLKQQTPQPFDKQWLDVTFTVDRDGRVRNAVVARQSGEIDRTWIGEALRALTARRYAVRGDAGQGAEGALRRERITLTARHVSITGSRIPVREARPVVEFVDISADRLPYLAGRR